MKFEEKMDKLETLINELEGNHTDLEESIQKYTEAMTLVKECMDQLEKIEKNIQKIVTENGVEDFNIEE